jgi:hypothetical protein
MPSRTVPCVFALLSITAFASAKPPDQWPGPSPDPRFFAPHETAPYFTEPPQPGVRRTSPPLPAERLRRGRFQSVQVNTDEFGNNIIGDAANEPSLAVDPNMPARMVIGWRQFDTIESDFRQAGWGWSHDYGQTWTFPGVLEEGVFRSDPVVCGSRQGVFYYYSLDLFFNYGMFRSVDGGQSWTGPISAYGGDKGWMAVDQTGGIGDGNIYAIWTGTYEFTRSVDGGLTYMAPIAVPGAPMDGTIAIGPEGQVYVAGVTYNYWFGLARSSNACNAAQTPEFELFSEFDLGGGLWGYDGPNPGGLIGQVWVACDCSTGPYRGNVYVLASVQRWSSYDYSTDVMFTRSSDGGQTWSTPVRINDDPEPSPGWQWFGTLAVAPNGRIDATWNDTRASGVVNISEVYYSYSTDGGQTWSVNEPITPAWDSWIGWPVQNKIGDYCQVVSDGLSAGLAYAATFNGEEDVYFVRIGPPDCNNNGAPDYEDIASGVSHDMNGNGVPDECDQDCNHNGTLDWLDLDPTDPDGDGWVSPDCNLNGKPDECEVGGTEDCNSNGVPDLCDIYGGASLDCDGNGVPDECDITAEGADCNLNGIPDRCDLVDGTAQDCNGNGILDECDIASGASLDCQPNGIPDECEPTPMQDECAAALILCPGLVYYGTTIGATCDGAASCGGSGATPDVWYYYQPYGSGYLELSMCDSQFDTVISIHGGCPGTTANQLACNDDQCGVQSWVRLFVVSGRSYWIRVSGAGGAVGFFSLTVSGPPCAYGPDCNLNGIPDECEPDCNGNGQPDDCDIAQGVSLDADGDGIPDECEPRLGDLNCDGQTNTFDIDPFVLALVAPDQYAAAFPACDRGNADCNEDGAVNAFDIDPFVRLLTGR